MKLFALRNANRERIPDFDYFSNKKDAKEVRDRLANESFVTLGPDHWRYTGTVKANAKKKGKKDWRDKS